ncbi:hypothetical protein A3726_02900 [Erythrobacter sp. HI0037]|nr:hypothetical protein A3719_04905 [Erythrobacter sp. HI0020]KZY18582.1 hypothetical protein A3727_03075 [Erythrobacter sp. HI0038]KZY24993.1 hypothetical protein A3726_26345 [Erythrobacter sp. HI0037]KZY28898.1 hypothetical protein A3726_02900 [Erythrobacter sp. HI0037]
MIQLNRPFRKVGPDGQNAGLDCVFHHLTRIMTCAGAMAPFLPPGIVGVLAIKKDAKASPLTFSYRQSYQALLECPREQVKLNCIGHSFPETSAHDDFFPSCRSAILSVV